MHTRGPACQPVDGHQSWGYRRPTSRDARKNLFSLIEQVKEDRQPIEITSRRGDAVLVSRVDWEALDETAMLLRVPANAQWSMESLAEARTGVREEHTLDRG